MRRHGFVQKIYERSTSIPFTKPLGLQLIRQKSTEKAQNSTSFPVPVALPRGNIGAYEVLEKAMQDPEILRLSNSLVMRENKDSNKVFSIQQLAKVTNTLDDDQVYVID